LSLFMVINPNIGWLKFYAGPTSPLEYCSGTGTVLYHVVHII